VVVAAPGGPENMRLSDVPDLVARADEVVVEVAAAGVNRADLLQRQGKYPPPEGASALLGLECSGVVSSVGEDVTAWSRGDQVCALLSGGGYAEKASVPSGQLLRVPMGVSGVEAAALPEAVCTVWSNLVMLAGLERDETVLIHGGGSGIGTMAIQIAKLRGARVLVTGGSNRKLDACKTLGADVAINYHEQDFVDAVKDATGGPGADVILDVIGAKYLDANLRALATDGRLVVIGLQGGTRAELDLGRLLHRRVSVIGSTLRSRSTQQKSAIVQAVRVEVWPAIESGEVRPIVDQVIPWDRVADAHRVLEDGTNIGKVVLQIS
jgi:putative PIG3 family NAD(P)H quinone oxidoreductase